MVRALAFYQYMWLRFKSWCRCHMWVEFVVGSLPMLREVFLWVLRFSPLLKNQYFQIPIRPGIRRRTTMWMCYLQIVIYLFILFISSVWRFIQRSLESARTDKPFIPCTLVALVLCRWEGKLESILLLIPWVKNSLCCECSQTLTETGTLFRPKS